MSALPSPEYSRNMRLIGHSDQGGRPDGVQLMVHRGFAYIGHMVSQGFSVVDVRDPTRPTTVNYIAAPPGTWRSRGKSVSCRLTASVFTASGTSAGAGRMCPR